MNFSSSLLGLLSLGLASTFAHGANIVANGDFSAGNASFNSEYSVLGTPGACAGPALGTGCYAVTTSANAVHPGFSNFPDHTGGGGNMMVANGASSPQFVWRQTLTVTPNTSYGISMWAASAVNDPAPANLRIEVDISGACGAVGTFATVGTLDATSAAGAWKQSQGLFVSGASTSVCLRLVNQNTAFSGNDFAIDDIVVDSVLAAASPIAAPDSGSTSPNVPVTLNALANDTVGAAPLAPATLDLNPGVPGVQTTFTDPGKGTFTVTNGGNVQFTPVAGFLGVARASYVVSGTDGSPSNVTTVTVTVSAPTPTSVPTLSQWGMLLLSGLLGLMGLAAARRRQ